MPRFLYILLLVMTFEGSAQAPPSWIGYTSRVATYPENSYLTGFMSENNTALLEENILLGRLTAYAKEQLANSISVQVNSISTLNIHNMNAASYEEFKHSSVSFSSATIAGLKSETYYDAKKKVGYALVYAKISDVVTYYENDILRLTGLLNSQFDLANQRKDKADTEGALEILFKQETLIRQAESDQTLLVTLTGKYDLPSLKRSELNAMKIKLEEHISSIKTMEQFSLEDAAFFIAFALKTQSIPDQPIRVSNLTYQDTPMGSPFSRRFKNALEQKLTQLGFRIADEASENALILKGTYWEQGDRLKISVLLRDQKTSEAKASVDTYIPTQLLTNLQVPFTPENYKEALVNMKELSANEIKGGELVLELFTNNGKENLIFTEGDIMKLFVRANRECYLRFIYHLADGSKVLLLDNYYINSENINQTYELPYEFECAEPFGVETLQLNAQSTPFERLSTRTEYGYNFIIDDTQTVVTKTRGFKKVETDELKAEKRLMLTTMTK